MKRDQEIGMLQEKVNYMKSIKNEMEKHVNDYKIYEDFLTKVISKSKDMKSTHDVLNRYKIICVKQLRQLSG